ncbi:MAG: MarR family winged helix-turn-helix transcriptional regulator [Eggerthellaceae bacterium]|jgi:DNA-binding MarR family transcriptional regulator
MNDVQLIEEVRAFNRFYLPFMNLLGRHYLKSEYSAAEARVLFEIYQAEGCTAAYISQKMGLDKSYVSRILSSYDKQHYLLREKSQEDGRSQALYLTDLGKKRAEDFIEKSNTEISELLAFLSPSEKEELYQAIRTIMRLLSQGKTK